MAVLFFCVLHSCCYGYEGNKAFDFWISTINWVFLTVLRIYQPLSRNIDRSIRSDKIRGDLQAPTSTLLSLITTNSVFCENI
jgi:hypothetical protein